MKTFWLIVPLALVMANCTPEIIDDEYKTNLDKMNELVIQDPLVWNSLVNQSMVIDTTGSGMKAGTGMEKETTFPSHQSKPKNFLFPLKKRCSWMPIRNSKPGPKVTEKIIRNGIKTLTEIIFSRTFD